MTTLDASETCLQVRGLGTDLRIEGRGAADALAEIRRLEGLLSRFRPTPLTTLNFQGTLANPPSELYEAVRYALKVAQDTGGLLTPAVHAALVAAGYDDRPGSPAQPPVPVPVPVPDIQAVVCTPQQLTLPPGLTLDLGGTGKGWIATRAATRLLPPFVLDAGGDLLTEQDEPFSLEIEHPFGGDARRLTFPAGRWGVATSSTRKRAWAGGHHLIDPRTGRPLHSDVVQATAICRTVLDAEIFAKLAFFGPDSVRFQQTRRALLALYAFDRAGQMRRWQGDTWEEVP